MAAHRESLNDDEDQDDDHRDAKPTALPWELRPGFGAPPFCYHPNVQTHLHYLTREFPGIGGAIKQRPEDFFVQEVPLYEPAGDGEHVYCEIQKVGLTTFEA